LLATLGVPQSAGRVATCDDNVVAEAFFATLKRELVHNQRFGGLSEARRAIDACIHCSNTVRLHSPIGYVPPVGYELRYARQGMAAASFRLSSKWGESHLLRDKMLAGDWGRVASLRASANVVGVLDVLLDATAWARRRCQRRSGRSTRGQRSTSRTRALAWS
jgi:hypothetical protein